MFSGMKDSGNLIDGFINSYVIGNGLDRRTEKAYRMDLEHFYVWADSKARADVGGGKAQQEKRPAGPELPVRKKSSARPKQPVRSGWKLIWIT